MYGHFKLLSSLLVANQLEIFATNSVLHATIELRFYTPTVNIILNAIFLNMFKTLVSKQND